jgi:hypothetical protein
LTVNPAIRTVWAWREGSLNFSIRKRAIGSLCQEFVDGQPYDDFVAGDASA